MTFADFVEERAEQLNDDVDAVDRICQRLAVVGLLERKGDDDHPTFTGLDAYLVLDVLVEHGKATVG
jgi:hypothetical protein